MIIISNAENSEIIVLLHILGCDICQQQYLISLFVWMLFPEIAIIKPAFVSIVQQSQLEMHIVTLKFLQLFNLTVLKGYNQGRYNLIALVSIFIGWRHFYLSRGKNLNKMEKQMLNFLFASTKCYEP